MQVKIQLKPQETVIGKYGTYYHKREASISTHYNVHTDLFLMLKEAAELSGSEWASAGFEEGEYREITYYAETPFNPEMWVASKREGGFYVRGMSSEAAFTVSRGYEKIGYGRNTWQGEYTGDAELIKSSRYRTFMEHPAGYGVGLLDFLPDRTFRASQSASCD